MKIIRGDFDKAKGTHPFPHLAKTWKKEWRFPFWPFEAERLP